MATLAWFFRRVAPAPAPETGAYDPYRLRQLPHQDVYFFSKKIDNSRVAREADPQDRRACRAAVGGACAVLTLLGLILAPNAANTLAGYRLEALRAEQRQLVEQSRALAVQEAELLSPGNLERLAADRGLMAPKAGQVVHLDPQNEGSVALLRR
jgi:hypothetical protein